MANLFSAVTKKELGNVFIVISDLKATYEGGSGALIQSLNNLDNETKRISIDLAPVKPNSNEVFRILRKKLFESVGDDANIEEIATAYSNEIRKALEDKHKFTSDFDSDTFRQKVELRLFASQEMEWTEVKKRAGMNPAWQWHRVDALDRMKQKMVASHIWRENGKFINKGPHPKEETGELEVRFPREIFVIPRMDRILRNSEEGIAIPLSLIKNAECWQLPK
jgi:hypothetical protein